MKKNTILTIAYLLISFLVGIIFGINGTIPFIGGIIVGILIFLKD